MKQYCIFIYRYTYDSGGNITSKKHYAYTTSTTEPNLTNATILSTDTYVYGDSNWKDLLTSYNGTAITYDAIGNALSWRDGMTFIVDKFYMGKWKTVTDSNKVRNNRILYI